MFPTTKTNLIRMTVLPEEEYEQTRSLLLLSFIKSMVVEENVRMNILTASLDKLRRIQQKVTFLDKESELNYLRSVAKQFCINFLQATSKKELTKNTNER